jgi:hypothetical protein
MTGVADKDAEHHADENDRRELRPHCVSPTGSPASRSLTENRALQ